MVYRTHSILVATFCDLLELETDRTAIFDRLKASASSLFGDIVMISSTEGMRRRAAGEAQSPEFGIDRLEEAVDRATMRAADARATAVRRVLGRIATKALARI